jgi:hypothetical protein
MVGAGRQHGLTLWVARRWAETTIVSILRTQSILTRRTWST